MARCLSGSSCAAETPSPLHFWEPLFSCTCCSNDSKSLPLIWLPAIAGNDPVDDLPLVPVRELMLRDMPIY
jgi:hypothetical protein